MSCSVRRLPFLLLFAAVVSGCGGDGDSGSSAPADRAADGATASEKPAADTPAPRDGSDPDQQLPSDLASGEPAPKSEPGSCAEGSSPRALVLPESDSEPLVDAANAWLGQHRPRHGLVSEAGEVRYGCAAGVRYAYASNLEHAMSDCPNDVPAWLRSELGSPDWQAQYVSCEGGIDGVCRFTPAPMRRVWFGTKLHGPSGCSGWTKVERQPQPQRCQGDGFRVAELRGDVSCDAAVAAWQDFEAATGDAAQRTGWSCFTAKQDPERLGSCGTGGTQGDVSKWPTAFVALPT